MFSLQKRDDVIEVLANAKVLIILQYINVSNQDILSVWNLYSALCILHLKKKRNQYSNTGSGSVSFITSGLRNRHNVSSILQYSVH